MAAERYIQILELLQAQRSEIHGKSKLCTVAAQITHLDGAAVVLVSTGNELIEFCASNDLASRLIDLESGVGQGPCLEAWQSSESILEPELFTHGAARWSLYGPLVSAEGVQAVFAIPVQIGAVRLGSLLLFRKEAGALTKEQLSDSILLASMVARAVLALQSGANDSLLSGELEREATFDFVIQQAAGMVAVQGEMSVHEALVLIRAHGFGTGESSPVLARHIVARELAYDPNSGQWISVRPKEEY